MPADETLQQMEARHERETEELDEKVAAHLETVKANSKGKKGKAALDAAEREVEQWRYELTERQKEELEEMEGGGAGYTAKEQPVVEKTETVAERRQREAREEKERVDRKKEKAQQKRQGKADKEREKDAEKERERLEAGPSARELELVALTTSLAKRKPPLKVAEVAADGNCLYHAVGDQIRRVRPDLHTWQRSPDQTYAEVRTLCASFLRKDVDGYAPFAELADGEDFARYCDRVENSCDWGGELELRALAAGLRVPILVHRADEAQTLLHPWRTL